MIADIRNGIDWLDIQDGRRLPQDLIIEILIVTSLCCQNSIQLQPPTAPLCLYSIEIPNLMHIIKQGARDESP